MDWLDKQLARFSQTKEAKTHAELLSDAAMAHSTEPKSSYYGDDYIVVEELYDGEKTMGELGSPIDYIPSYQNLSARSWQAFTESDLAQIIVKADVNWVISSGLKLQAEPIVGVIESEGYSFNSEEFKKTTEERFRLFAKTNNSTYNNMQNYNKYQRTARLNAIVGGDILCIEMFENGLPAKRLIDGRHVVNPSPEYFEAAEKRGNTIVHGVEIMPTGEHYAFYVINKDYSYTQILARGEKTNRLQAYLYYGSEYRIDAVRGMPMLWAVLEKMKKLDRFNEAMVAGTEEKAKVPWVWKHDVNAEGTNPQLGKTLNAMAGTVAAGGELDFTDANKLIKKTYEKTAINAPPGASLETLNAGMEVNQEAFTTGNFIYMCAAVEIPYEVALMKYVNSFSSSRMASQSYQKILDIKRIGFNDAYNKPFYNLFLEAQVLSGKIKADGFLSAINSGDIILAEAYRNCRFIGINVPQADPFKEAKAMELMLSMLVTNRDQIIEALGNGDDFEAILDKLAAEQSLIDEKLPEPAPEPDKQNNE